MGTSTSSPSSEGRRFFLGRILEWVGAGALVGWGALMAAVLPELERRRFLRALLLLLPGWGLSGSVGAVLSSDLAGCTALSAT